MRVLVSMGKEVFDKLEGDRGYINRSNYISGLIMGQKLGGEIVYDDSIPGGLADVLGVRPVEKPVEALVPEVSEFDTWLEESGLDVVINDRREDYDLDTGVDYPNMATRVQIIRQVNNLRQGGSREQVFNLARKYKISAK